MHKASLVENAVLAECAVDRASKPGHEVAGRDWAGLVRLIEERDDLVAGLEEGDEWADCENLAGAVGTWNTGWRRRERIHALRNKHVPVVERCVVELDEDFLFVQSGDPCCFVEEQTVEARAFFDRPLLGGCGSGHLGRIVSDCLSDMEGVYEFGN